MAANLLRSILPGTLRGAVAAAVGVGVGVLVALVPACGGGGDSGGGDGGPDGSVGGTNTFSGTVESVMLTPTAGISFSASQLAMTGAIPFQLIPGGTALILTEQSGLCSDLQTGSNPNGQTYLAIELFQTNSQGNVVAPTPATYTVTLGDVIEGNQSYAVAWFLELETTSCSNATVYSQAEPMLGSVNLETGGPAYSGTFNLNFGGSNVSGEFNTSSCTITSVPDGGVKCQ